MQWKTVTYGGSSQKCPSKRWGHRLIATNSNQIVLFGGFGGSSADGEYLGDLWSFSTVTHTWKSVATTGHVPQCRSNYTIHYDAVNDCIILFGGGSNNKTRYNSVSLLNWKNKVWTNYLPEMSEPAPWERTYHSSQFSYPYLIVHGGEGVSNLDLDDLWVFNVISKKWKEIKFDNDGIIPKKRRFHSTALLNGYFYIFAGCTGNYQLLGDAYRVDLRRLFESGEENNYQWEALVPRNKMLERWGQASNVYNGKIYISFGRVSAYADNSDILCFDLATMRLSKMQVKKETEPIARRRHASIMIGNCLLVFGGYNGKYLNDCYYLTICENESALMNKQAIVYASQVELLEQLKEKQAKINHNETVVLTKRGLKVFTIHSDKEKLAKNSFMKYCLQYSHNNFSLELPSFCDVTMFRIINAYITNEQVALSNDFSIDFYAKLLLSSQYFLCQQLNPFIEKQMMKGINELNCKDLLELGEQFGLNQLKFAAGELYFLGRSQQNADISNKSSSHLSPSPEEPQRQELKSIAKARCTKIQEFYETIKFSIEQKRLKEDNIGFFERAAKAFKAVFSKPSRPQSAQQPIKGQKQLGCLAKIADFVATICSSPKVNTQQRV